ncbi:MAG: VWA domain-containing protein [Crocinitomicaceae bacterium]
MLSNWNIWPFSYTYLHPYWFLALLALPILAYFLFKKEKQLSFSARITQSANPEKNALHWVGTFRKATIYVKLLIYTLLVFALAGPFSWNNNDGRQEDYKNGIDMVIAMDVSLSMYARDFLPSRLDAAKRVAMEFVQGRKGDRIGLVVYAGEAYTACPPTLDYKVLIEQIAKVSGEYIDGGTAIGVGLGTAVSRMRSDSKSSKAIILLTDGTNNAGDLSPERAAELAKALNIRVYTIGVGTNGEALSPVITPFGVRFEMQPVEIDEKTLKNIADKTDGQYFRATDEETLIEIYEKIEKLEKNRFLDQVYQSESPADPSAFLLWAIVLALLVSMYPLLLFKHAA